jgi:hypothetical protein
MFNRYALLIIVALFSSACGPRLATPTLVLPESGVSLEQRQGAWFFVSPVTVGLPLDAVETSFAARVKELSGTGFLSSDFSKEQYAVPARVELPLVSKSLPRTVIRLQLDVSVVSWDGHVETTSVSRTMVYDFDNR